MNWLDILLILVVLLSAVAGFARGFIRMGIGLAAVFLGFILGAWFYGHVSHALLPYVASRDIANILGFLIVFAAVMVAGALVAILISKLFRLVGLSWLDRLAGAAFGVVRGALVAIILVMLFAAFTPGPAPSAIVESRFAPHLIEASNLLAAMTPNELKSGFKRSYTEAKKFWKDALQKKSAKKLPEHRI